jgi:hypothetical protein
MLASPASDHAQYHFTCTLCQLILLTVTSPGVSIAGYLISCVSTGMSMALAIGPPLIIPFLLFGGFFLNNR